MVGGGLDGWDAEAALGAILLFATKLQEMNTFCAKFNCV
jgi:hypothetical protein